MIKPLKIRRMKRFKIHFAWKWWFSYVNNRPSLETKCNHNLRCKECSRCRKESSSGFTMIITPEKWTKIISVVAEKNIHISISNFKHIDRPYSESKEKKESKVKHTHCVMHLPELWAPCSWTKQIILLKIILCQWMNSMINEKGP